MIDIDTPTVLDTPDVRDSPDAIDVPVVLDSPAIGATPEHLAALERLGDEIAVLSAHLEAATARLLDLIREFDARGGWRNGFRSCAAWLSWRVGLDMGAARERVRVARALGTLPRLAQALARGELSYAKVRALTRVATPETEERLLAVGRAGTAEHVERIVRAWRSVDRKAEAEESARRHTSRALHVYQDADGMVTIRGRLEPEAGALLLRALEAARERLYQQTWSTPRTRTEEPDPTAWPDTAAAPRDEDAELATGTRTPPFEAEIDPLLRPMLPPPAELPTLDQQQAEGWAIDVLHPLATGERQSAPMPRADHSPFADPCDLGDDWNPEWKALAEDGEFRSCYILHPLSHEPAETEDRDPDAGPPARRL